MQILAVKSHVHVCGQQRATLMHVRRRRQRRLIVVHMCRCRQSTAIWVHVGSDCLGYIHAGVGNPELFCIMWAVIVLVRICRCD